MIHIFRALYIPYNSLQERIRNGFGRHPDDLPSSISRMKFFVIKKLVSLSMHDDLDEISSI